MNILGLIQKNSVELILEKERKKNKVLGINQQGKDISFSEDKIFCSMTSKKSTLEDNLEYLQNLEQEKKILKERISLEELFELVKEEKEGLNLDEVTGLIFDEDRMLEKIAVFEKIAEDKVYFKLKDRNAVPKKQEEVEEALRLIEIKRQKELLKNHEEEKTLEWLKENLSGRQVEVPDFAVNYLNPVRNLAIRGDEYAKKNHAVDILNRISRETGYNIQGNIEYAAFRLLKDIGIFDEDENLFLQKHAVSLSFDHHEIRESDIIILDHTIDLRGRKDFRELKSFSIDDEDTRDIDDALSFEKIEGGYRFYVHIADVADIIPLNGALYENALKRTSSIYLPDQKIPMLPAPLSEDICSLIENQDRYAISNIIETDEKFKIKSHKIEPSVIRITTNMSYNQVDRILEEETAGDYEYFKKLYDFGVTFSRKRLNEWNGVDFLFPSVSPKVEDGKIILKDFDPFSKSNLIVREFMILTNFLTARYCEENDIPAIYIAQDPPDSPLPIDNRQITNKVFLQEIVRYMKKSYFTVNTKNHFALGLRAYTQSTSPIRRLLDMIIQYQIKSYLDMGKPHFSEEDLLNLKSNIELQKPVISQIENDTNQYWLLKYLLKHYRNKSLKGQVIRELPDGYLVEIEKTRTFSKIISQKSLEPGDIITVKLHTIIPRLGLSLGNF